MTITDPRWAVRARGLVKTFGDNRAVDGIDLDIRTGAVYGVLGPNGAGRTTTIRMLATLLRPDAGTAEVFGRDVRRTADRLLAGYGLAEAAGRPLKNFSGGLRRRLDLAASLIARPPAGR